MKYIINIIVLYLLPTMIMCMENNQWELCTTFEHSSPVSSAYFTDKGKTLITCAGNSIYSIDMESHRKTPILLHNQICDSACVDPSGRILAVSLDANSDSKIYLFDRSTLEEKNSFHSNRIVAPTHFDSTGELLATTSPDGTAIFNIRSGKKISELRTTWVNDIHFHPQKKIVAIATAEPDGNIHLLDIDNNVTTNFAFNKALYATCFNKTGEMLAITMGNKINIFDPFNKKTFNEIPLSGASSICFNNDDATLAALSDDQLLLYDIKTAQKTFSTQHNYSPYKSIAINCFSPDGVFLVALVKNYVKIFKKNP